ncbi:primase C-terminal domain-containing protein, partial [Klebsiella variicola]
LYTLDWLADFLDLNAASDKDIVADYGLGRNCTLFDKTRKWAYRAIRQGWPEYDQWLQACYERASAYNLQFPAPLDENEVKGIAKSIAKWTNNKFSEISFNDYVKKSHSPDIQKRRGKRGGEVGGLISKGGGRPVIESSDNYTKPWISMGISRATYYRKKNEKL